MRRVAEVRVFFVVAGLVVILVLVEVIVWAGPRLRFLAMSYRKPGCVLRLECRSVQISRWS
jgi:hypothetical protein